jgi:hypothetical protein
MLGMHAETHEHLHTVPITVTKISMSEQILVNLPCIFYETLLISS